MSVFISWSGDRSKQVAEALNDWLPNVIQTVERFISTADIDQGAEWWSKIREQLDSSSVGIICLTPENLDSTWLLFEAGALSKKVGEDAANVCTYLFALEYSGVSQPLAHYQATKANRDDTLKLVQTINRKLTPELQISPEIVEKAFEKFWPELKAKLAAIPLPDSLLDNPARTSEEMLEELLGLVRGLSRQSPSERPFTEYLRKHPEIAGGGTYSRISPEDALYPDNKAMHELLGELSARSQVEGPVTTYELSNGTLVTINSQPARIRLIDRLHDHVMRQRSDSEGVDDSSQRN